MNVLEAIRKRRSVNFFDRNKPLDEELIRRLVEMATEAPSSFNMQNWSFVAVTGQSEKKMLRMAAMDQEKVEDAPVTFIILGDLDGYKNSPRVMELSVKAGVIDPGVRDFFTGGTVRMYSGFPQLARDEAIRSGALAAMTMMLAAEGMGLVSCPMIGFDHEQVKTQFGISDQFVPVMLLPVGYEAPGNWSRKIRRPVGEVLSWNAFSGR